MLSKSHALLYFLLLLTLPCAAAEPQAEVVSFQSGEITLHGTLYKPEGKGPFPAVVYNHGSAPGLVSKQAFEILGPVFAKHGWVFFGPYRRGQGLSASAGPYIGDQIADAEKKGGQRAGAATMVRLLETDHLNDQLAALTWLRTQSFVDPDRVAVAGTSFGGIEVVIGTEKASYCAGVDSAGAAQSWGDAPEVQDLMTRAVRNSKAPIFFFQAANDYDLSPSRTLSAAMKNAGKEFEVKIYPAFGRSVQDGHSFGYFGSEVWGPDAFRFLNLHCENKLTKPNVATGQEQGATRDPKRIVEQVIRRLDDERIQAQIHADAAALDHIYADDFIGVGPSGIVRTKPQVISDFTSGDLKFQSITTDDVRVRIYGNAAVETGRSTMNGQDKGKAVPHDTRFTRVWVKQQGRWRLVANHYSSSMPHP